MKKILCYLMLVLTCISFDSLGAVKKEKYNPEGKEVFIFNEYDSSAIGSKEYGGLYTSPNINSLYYPPYKKYKGREGYLDKEVKVGRDTYQKIILKNGEVFYLSDLKYYYGFESLKNYKKRLEQIEKFKNIKFPNIDELSVTEVVTESKDIYIITFSNGQKLYNEQLEGLLQLSKKITDANDFRQLLDAINTKNIHFSYDPIDNLAKIKLDSDYLKIYISILKERVYLTTVQVICSSYDGISAKNFKIYQSGNTYNSPSDLTFKREYGSYVYEWYNFILNNEFISYINSLDDTQDAIIRFYGLKRNRDDNIDSKSISEIKKILALNETLAKYLKFASDNETIK